VIGADAGRTAGVWVAELRNGASNLEIIQAKQQLVRYTLQDGRKTRTAELRKTDRRKAQNAR
jgi:hypothetical protein